MARRDDLAKALYIADNRNQSVKDSLDDWKVLTEDRGTSYTYPLADAALEWFDQQK